MEEIFKTTSLFFKLYVSAFLIEGQNFVHSGIGTIRFSKSNYLQITENFIESNKINQSYAALEKKKKKNS